MAVIKGKFETQGTSVYFANPTESDPAVLKMTCPTAITGLGGGSADKIDTTCLDIVSKFREYIGGLADADELPIPFVLYREDDGTLDASHAALFALRNSGAVVGWYVGLSDDDGAPTLDTDHMFVSPAGRTGFVLSAYISNLTIDIATNEVVRGTVTLQPTGDTELQEAA